MSRRDKILVKKIEENFFACRRYATTSSDVKHQLGKLTTEFSEKTENHQTHMEASATNREIYRKRFNKIQVKIELEIK